MATDRCYCQHCAQYLSFRWPPRRHRNCPLAKASLPGEEHMTGPWKEYIDGRIVEFHEDFLKGFLKEQNRLAASGCRLPAQLAEARKAMEADPCECPGCAKAECPCTHCVLSRAERAAVENLRTIREARAKVNHCEGAS